ncbi:ExeM/NucH family extracellular endonuclease [Rothia kristinae]|uniref:ExeM/NucH family extracellular endonuclease n=1 Tax=Rothia kristinae TaxID=37923 RepID=UPI0033D48E93
MHPPRSAPLRPLALGAAAILFLLGSVPAGAEPLPSSAPAASAASTSSAEAADAADATELSEISYAGPDDADFLEIAAPAGTDLSGWTVGSLTRGGTPQSEQHLRTLPEGTVIDDSGLLMVRLPIANAVKTGDRADGAYGSSAFIIDAAGAVVDFDQIGGVTGGRGLTAGTSPSVPQPLRGLAATPIGETAPAGSSLQFDGSTWTAAAPTPGTRSPRVPDPQPSGSDEPGDVVPIARIQGTGDSSPLVDQAVTTEGVVTAAYPEGGLRGYTVQTPGTGGDSDLTPGASDGIFVYSPDTAGLVRVGDHVRVSGTVAEYYGQTQISVSSGGLSLLDTPADAVTPVSGQLPEDPTAREALEGMLLLPTGDITVTDAYDTGRYGEVRLANGTEPLKQTTDVVAPGEPARAYEVNSAAREYVLDDGATADYTRGASDTPVPYLSTEHPARVGAPVVFDHPVVLGYGFDAWRLQPTGWVTGDSALPSPARFGDTRTQAPAPVGGDLSVASFNVLNYFTTTGDQLPGCRFYTDRAGNPVTVRDGCAVRGAADAQNLARQQAKIVAAINRMDTAVLSLEEIENSAAVGGDRDEALSTLVDALNEAAGHRRWAFVPSPSALPAEEDVIRTAFIYQPDRVRPVGDSVILTDSPAFANARQPLAQAFAPAGTPQDQEKPDRMILAVVNHFKSKGSGSGEGNEDTGDGQGRSTADRVRQAQALRDFASARAEALGTQNVLLLGDFNAYTREDPLQVLYEAGYTDIGSAKKAGSTYVYGGRSGSLDHVLASGPLFSHVTGASVWSINSVESVSLEYSRYNSNAKDLYAPGPFRSSDHDPLVVGLTWPGADDAEQPAPGPSPTTEPTGEPTPEPSAGPTSSAPSPTAEPTTVPTPAPTVAPSPSGTASDPGAGAGPAEPSEPSARDPRDPGQGPVAPDGSGEIGEAGTSQADRGSGRPSESGPSADEAGGSQGLAVTGAWVAGPLGAGVGLGLLGWLLVRRARRTHP